MYYLCLCIEHVYTLLVDKKTYGQVHVMNLKETPNPYYILREFLVHHEEVSEGEEG